MPLRQTKYFLSVLTLIFLTLFVLTISGFFASLILGILLAILAYPLYKSLLRNFGERENLAALTALFIIALIIILPALGLLAVLTAEAIDLFTSVKNQFLVGDELVKYLEPLAAEFNINLERFVDEQLIPAVKSLGLALSKEIGGLLSSALNLGLHLFIMVMTIFYMLRDGERFGKYLIELSPLKTEKEMELYRTFKDTGKAVFYGNFLSGIVQGILGGIGFAIFGIGSPVLWGAVMAFFGLIPFLGPFVVFIPAAIYLFAVGDTASAIIFLAYNIIIVSSVDNLIKPKVIGGKVNIHPLLMLLAILGGLSAFGIMGIIYGPIIVTVFLAVLKIYLADGADRPA